MQSCSRRAWSCKEKQRVLLFRCLSGDLSLDEKRSLCERDAPVASIEALEVRLDLNFPASLKAQGSPGLRHDEEDWQMGREESLSLMRR